MEAPASLLVALIIMVEADLSAMLIIFLLIWQLHYFHRAFIYPFTIKGRASMPVSIMLLAILFNSINAILIAYHFVFNAADYDLGWLYSTYFISGIAMFALGFAITKRSDAILRSLPGPGEDGYKIPHGFLYKYISCPNYFGEIIQWAGWALLTMSPAGFVFFIWTIANLAPRALTHHRWYKETFLDYPAERKALVPGII